MAVLMGIAVAWKMFPTGQHTILLNPFNDSYAQCIHEIWIGTKVLVDDGAVAKLREEGKSLLPIGMTAVEGEFSRGDVIAIKDSSGTEVARGLSNYASAEARLMCRKASAEIERLLGYVAEAEMVHRDNLVLHR